MAEVNPAEISAILKQQLSNHDANISFDETGTVLTIGDGIARVYGLSNVQYGELVEFSNGIEGIVLNLEEDNVGVVLLGASNEIKEGDTVKRTTRIASINVGEGIVGRVVNTLGQPIDGKGSIQGDLYEMPLERKAPWYGKRMEEQWPHEVVQVYIGKKNSKVKRALKELKGFEKISFWF